MINCFKLMKIIVLCIPFFVLLLSRRIKAEQYKYYSYTDIFSFFESLSRTCPQYIKIDTSQNRYGLNSVPGCGNSDCFNLIVYLTDFDSLTLNRPQYYISGLVHGNEEIGPTTIVEFAKYFCDNNQSNSLFHNILKTKMFIMTPMTNAYGYYNHNREDKVIEFGNRKAFEDPNRDFPYSNDNKEVMPCMKTITGRTINEIFNEHIISGAITFHGGTNVLGYAWGNYIHKKGNRSTEAPDHSAFKTIGEVMRDASSSELNQKTRIPDYLLGDMTSTVYPVNGGLEDWAYGGSWENDYVDQKPIKICRADSFGKYDMEWKEKNNLNKEKLKCLMYLAETADDKKPIESTLGNDDAFKNKSIFDFENTKNFYGHIPRNMRLIYSGSDLISASIFIDASKITTKEDTKQVIFPYRIMGCKTLKTISIYKYSFHTVNKEILYINNIFEKSIEIAKIENPICYWSDYSKTYNLEINSTIIDDRAPFSYESKGTIYFIRGEGPDSEWKSQIKPDPNVEPQSHIVKSKTIKNYNISNGNFTLRSNYYFYSHPIIILENGFVSVVDDIDSLFYKMNQDVLLIPFHSTMYDYNLSTLVDFEQKKNSHSLSSEIVFEVSVTILFSESNSKISSIINKEYHKSGEEIAKIALNNGNENLNYSSMPCTFYKSKHNRDIIIKCENILKENKINGYFIRNNLVNSIITLNLNKNDEKRDFIGVFSIDKSSKGKFYNADNKEYFCSSMINFHNNGNILPKDYSTNDYIISIQRQSNTVLNITFDSNSFSNFTTYLVIFPFTNMYLFFDKTMNANVFLSETSDGKIIGKTVYVFKIMHEETLNFIKKFLKEKNYLQFLLEIQNKFDSTFKISQCSIISNKIYNSENFSILKKISPVSNTYESLLDDPLYWYLLVGGITTIVTVGLFFLLKFIWKKMCRKYCFKEYDELSTRQEIEVMDFKI